MTIVFISGVLSGCAPVPPSTPSPQTPETARPIIGGCPASFQTVVSAVFSGYGKAGSEYDPAAEGALLPSFDVIIIFNQPITLLDNDPRSWEVDVERLVQFRRGGILGTPHERSYRSEAGPLLSETEEVRIVRVEQFGTNSVRLRVQARELALGVAGGVAGEEYYFYGLICDVFSYEDYLAAANRNAGYGTAGPGDTFWMDRYLVQSPIYADRITWRYVGRSVPVADETGMPCLALHDIRDTSCCEAYPATPPPAAWCAVVEGEFLCP
ncbi:MAG TPA: hypothetical protein VLH40_03995 [Atribacteraceae bacterium]|nr:hypothetical protein [Atribacteraceae bacterium]